MDAYICILKLRFNFNIEWRTMKITAKDINLYLWSDINPFEIGEANAYAGSDKKRKKKKAKCDLGRLVRHSAANNIYSF